MVTEKTSVTITVRGKKYPFRAVADNLRVQQVVELVNFKLEELDRQSDQKHQGGVSEIRLVMLTLLNCVDECLAHQQVINEIEERSEILLNEIATFGL